MHSASDLTHSQNGNGTWNMNRPKGDDVFRMDPQKFMLWLFLAATTMIFAGLTSAYIVSRADGDWWSFPLPEAFFYGSIVIVISSLTMHLAYTGAKSDNILKVKAGLWTTLLLGITFCAGQIHGWMWLVENEIYLAGNPNPAGSFLYVLSGLHLAHIIAGLVFIAGTLWSAYRYRVHKKNTSGIYLCATFWHFLGILWVYLYVFLLLYR